MEKITTGDAAKNKLEEIKVWAKTLLYLSHKSSIEYKILSKLLKIIDK